MNKLSICKLAIVVSCLSCAEPPEVEPPEVERTSAALTNSTYTDDPPWAVDLELTNPSKPLGETCTGILLSEHWVLTAAHCFDKDPTRVRITTTLPGGMQGEPDFLGSGPIYTIEHPDLDLGLVYLPGGVSTAQTGVAEIYFDGTRQPWVDGDPNERLFDTIGYGDTNTVSGGGCKAGNPPYFKRKGEFDLEEGERRDLMVYGDSDVRDTCLGDSGAPWVLNRGGRQLAFAIHEGWINDWLDYQQKGVLIRPQLDWIAAESERHTDSYQLVFEIVAMVDHNVYVIEPREVTDPAPDPLPPPPGCDENEICCGDNPDGSCRACIPAEPHANCP